MEEQTINMKEKNAIPKEYDEYKKQYDDEKADIKERQSHMDVSGPEESLLLHTDRSSLKTDVENSVNSSVDHSMVDEVGDFEKTVLVPPDGGWGWLVAIGAFIIMTLLPTVGPCFGILFSGFLTESGVSSTTTSWIFNIQMFIWHIVGPLVNPLTLEFGWRRVGTVGVILTALAIILSAFSPSAGFLFFSFSFVSGVGNGLAITMCFIIVPQYFNKKRGLSNTFLMTGICFGQVMGAPLTRYLLDQYSFKGAALVFGAILLNGLIGISFFHPVQWHMKTKSVKGVSANTNLPSLKLTSNNKDNLEQVTTHTRHTTSTNDHDRPKREEERKFASATAKGGFAVLVDIIIRVVKFIISDIKIVKMYRARIICCGVALCVIGYMNFLMQIPFALQAADFSLQDASWCISIFGMSNMITRFIVSLLSDLPKFNLRICLMAGYGLASVSMFVFPFLTDLKLMVIAMIAMGCGIGANMALNNLILIKYMGLKNLAPTLGFSSLTVAFSCVTLGPLIGVIRDVSNSYAISMWIMSAMLAVSFFLWLFMPVAVRLDADKISEEDTMAVMNNNNN